VVPVADIQRPPIEGLDRGVKKRGCALLLVGLVHHWVYIPPSRRMTPDAAEKRKSERSMSTTTIDPAEVAKFEAMAADWWDPHGKFKPLHMLNPCRLDYITSQIAAEFGRDLTDQRPFEGLRLLDIGCGGGLLSEPMARLGAEVVGADAAAGNLPVARIHAEQSGLTIDYRHTTAEDLAAAGERFDVVLNMEVVEHVADPLAYLTACHDLLKPSGLMVCSTINRNPKSYAVAIFGAEVVMRWLPRGTHDWAKFITPDELYDLIRNAGLDPVDRKGMVFNPVRWSWSLSDRDLSVNYVTTALRRT
jgi:2-polyprenyl-6-hydroxyphenyl methylase/3-demethylubiquinone-9 3-methyltransferase